MKKVAVGVIGCGNISGIYLQNLTGLFKDMVEVFAVCDLEEARAREAAEKWNIPHIMNLEQLLGNKDIQLVLNLTTPKSHYELCKKCLEAGKHVYVEKPLSLSFEQGMELMNLAKDRGLLLGGAPDTFMGAGIQTCRKLIDDGYIGEPIAATAFMVCHGHESWHPDPAFYYKVGGGPLFDMGPYYLTALVNLMGSVSEVCGMSSAYFNERIITSEKKYGEKIQVETDTHIAGLLRFESGAICSMIFSFDVWNSALPRIEIYGTKGTLIVPDPNTFGGPARLFIKGNKESMEVPLTHTYEQNSRGLGIADMAKAISEGGTHRASGELQLHILEIMCAIQKSQAESKFQTITTKVKKIQAMPRENIKGVL